MQASKAILGICLAALVACGGDNDDGLDDTINRAQVRVVQAVVDAPVLDIYVTSAARLPAFPRVASGAGTGSVGLDQNADYQFIARVPGDPTILAQLDIRLPERDRQLLLVSGALNPAPGEQPMTITAFEDEDPQDLAAGQTRLRVLNATVDGATINASLVDLRPGANNQLVETPVAINGLAPVTGVELDVLANRLLPVTVGTTLFTAPALAPAGRETIAVIGSTAPDASGERALRLLRIPRTSPSNTTPLVSVQQNPLAVFVNGVPGAETQLTVNGATIALPYSAVSPIIQVPTTLSVTLGATAATIDGTLDPAATYIIVLSGDALGDGITMYAYRDALADSTETRVRAINATVGAGAREIAFAPAPVLGTDLVVGAASTSVGTLVADPTTVTAITATPITGTTFTYTTGITAAARYIVLVGDAAAAHGAVIVNNDWSASFVAAD